MSPSLNKLAEYVLEEKDKILSSSQTFNNQEMLSENINEQKMEEKEHDKSIDKQNLIKNTLKSVGNVKDSITKNFNSERKSEPSKIEYKKSFIKNG